MNLSEIKKLQSMTINELKSEFNNSTGETKYYEGRKTASETIEGSLTKTKNIIKADIKICDEQINYLHMKRELIVSLFDEKEEIINESTRKQES